MPSPEFYHKKRLRIIEQLGGECAKCGSTLVLEIDHKEPILMGRRRNAGTRLWDDIGNLQLLCRPCHMAKTKEENARREHEYPSGYS